MFIMILVRITALVDHAKEGLDIAGLGNGGDEFAGMPCRATFDATFFSVLIFHDGIQTSPSW